MRTRRISCSSSRNCRSISKPRPTSSKIPAERARLIRVFDRGIETATSYVLPIQVWHSQERGRRWVTERWALRREKLFLIPGDSPAGFRLPLSGLPYVAPINYPHVIPSDPMTQQRPLPRREMLLINRRAVTLEVPAALPTEPQEVVGAVRTALTIEPRDGHLQIFMPPVIDAEDYAALDRRRGGYRRRYRPQGPYRRLYAAVRCAASTSSR